MLSYDRIAFERQQPPHLVDIWRRPFPFKPDGGLHTFSMVARHAEFDFFPLILLDTAHAQPDQIYALHDHFYLAKTNIPTMETTSTKETSIKNKIQIKNQN